MSFIHRRNKNRFDAAVFAESTAYLPNPSCGWYQIYSFAMEEKQDFEELYWCLRAEETIVLAMVDIGAFREGEISEEALRNLADILEFFRKHEKEVILRISYDREGRGMEREPEFLKTVTGHMQQLGEVIRDYKEQILIIQGMLIGSWGEMHDSKFLSEERLKQLMHAWRQALGNELAIAVRTPQQWRMMHPEGTKAGSDKIGLFNDGMFGTLDHLGTYGWQNKEEAGWQGKWSREEELAFTREIAVQIPYGGEAVGESLEQTFEEMAEDLRRTNTCYLNKIHNEKRLNQWKEAYWTEDGIWNQTSVFDYIGCHLGYRFVVRNVEFTGKKNPQLQIFIENTGFATLKEEAELVLCAEDEKNKITYYTLSGSLCSIKPQETKEFVMELPDKIMAATHILSLKMRRKRDKKAILFANTLSESESVILGTLIKN